MGEFRGSKGPWEILEDDSELKVIQSRSVESGSGWRSYAPICEEVSGMNNARLIAAAPDLLEALQWAMAKIGPYSQRTSSNQTYCDQFDKANAAIAKALGQ